MEVSASLTHNNWTYYSSRNWIQYGSLSSWSSRFDSFCICHITLTNYGHFETLLLNNVQISEHHTVSYTMYFEIAKPTDMFFYSSSYRVYQMYIFVYKRYETEKFKFILHFKCHKHVCLYFSSININTHDKGETGQTWHLQSRLSNIK